MNVSDVKREENAEEYNLIHQSLSHDSVEIVPNVQSLESNCGCFSKQESIGPCPKMARVSLWAPCKYQPVREIHLEKVPKGEGSGSEALPGTTHFQTGKLGGKIHGWLLLQDLDPQNGFSLGSGFPVKPQKSILKKDILI